MAKAAKKADKNQPYFQKHRRTLAQVIREYEVNRTSQNLFNDFALFNNLEEGITAHRLRGYQMEALYLLDYLVKCPDNKPEKKDLLDDVDKDAQLKAPFLGFEMATGSGKTMLMGACMYFLSQRYGIRNFLIITPASTDIYQKTIRNFQIGNYESVWAPDTPFTFNLITGDNYTQNLFFDDSKDANIFVFNIAKFGANATNTEKTWESAVWRDEQGNSIGIRQFLKDKPLVIITDEAHHAQTTTAKRIIKNFHPQLVLEFTATSTETDSKTEKTRQSNVHKYDIRRFLEDGHGKLVRALALKTDDRKRKDEVTDGEKQKVIALALVHLLKKEAVLRDPKARGLKPIAFIKVKNDTEYTRKVFHYLREQLAEDTDNVDFVLDKVFEEEREITLLLRELITTQFSGDRVALRRALAEVCRLAIFYYSGCDKETEKKWAGIRKNDIEFVVYINRLDEGIDLPNIYSMAVINDTDSGMLTSVKQIIGRGVRLHKDNREFDDEETDRLKANAEMLHIICDKGKNFEGVIEAIQHEFGLNEKYLSFDQPKIYVTNQAKRELLEGKYIPKIRADFRVRQGVELYGLVEDVETIVGNFLENNCFSGDDDGVKCFLKYKPEGYFTEVNLFGEKEEYHRALQQGGGKPAPLRLTERERKGVYNIVIKRLNCLPDLPRTHRAFEAYFQKLNEIGLKYYRISEENDTDERMAKSLFVNAFAFYYQNHIEKSYFSLDIRRLRDDDSWNLYQHFKDEQIKIPASEQLNSKWYSEKDEGKLKSMVEEQRQFYGFRKSVYAYDKFDSFPEFKLARFLDEKLPGRELIKKEGYGVVSESYPGEWKQMNFWLRNQRQIFFTYGTKRYYPDFIVHKDGTLYLIETKGEVFSDNRKNALLLKLNDVEGIGDIRQYKSVIVFSENLDYDIKESADLETLIKRAETTQYRMQTHSEMVADPPAKEKYTKYVPVYSPEKALKRFVKEQKTGKPDGWYKFELAPGQEKFPESVFATQVKGTAMAPQKGHNEFIVLEYQEDFSKAVGKIALIWHEDIRDENYTDGFTIREVRLEDSKTKKSLFSKLLILQPVNEEYEPIVISDLARGDEAVVIGMEYVFESPF